MNTPKHLKHIWTILPERLKRKMLLENLTSAYRGLERRLERGNEKLLSEQKSYMKSEQKQIVNSLILDFINRYLKTGVVVQGKWAFFARGDLEQIVKVAYDSGYRNGLEMGQFEKELNKLL